MLLSCELNLGALENCWALMKIDFSSQRGARLTFEKSCLT